MPFQVSYFLTFQDGKRSLNPHMKTSYKGNADMKILKRIQQRKDQHFIA